MSSGHRASVKQQPDITSGGIQQSQPIDGYKSFLETSTAHLSAYVAAASIASSAQGGSGASATSHQHHAQPQSLVQPGKWEDPYFDDTTPRNVTALVGKSAYLSCRVKNLANKTVSWIRHRDIHILTVGSYTYTSDQRFQATHHKNTDDWTLQIKWAQKRDAGIYECQISTQPVRSYFVTLSVVVPTATIIGGPDLHVDKGSTINLTCAVKYSPEPPAYIFWYHHDEVISYDSSRGGVSVITEKGDVTTSHLLIQNADLDDSGKYSCSPSNADVASVRVHVLNVRAVVSGEHPEAMQTGGVGAHRVALASDTRLLLAGLLLLTATLTAVRQLHNLFAPSNRRTTVCSATGRAPLGIGELEQANHRQHRQSRTSARPVGPLETQTTTTTMTVQSRPGLDTSPTFPCGSNYRRLLRCDSER